MKVLVTGGAGFIGSHLVEKLRTSKHTVLVVDDMSGGKLENITSDTWAIMADCRDAAKMDYIFEIFKPELVYHLAANAAENKAQFSPIDITSRNYDAFIKVLTPFIKHGGKRFVFTSSIAVYGGIQTPFKETDKPEPEDLYGISKLSAEETLKVMSKVHDFEYVIARPHNVYGPKQNMTDPYRNVMTIWMNAILKGEPYYIYGDGEQRRCFSYIDDVIDALYKCGFEDVANMTFNIGSDKDFSLNQLHTTLKKITHKVQEPVYLPLRPQEVVNAISDHQEANKYLDYQDFTSFESGVRRTWMWCLKQGPQEPVYTEIEIPSDKLPSNWK